MSSQEELMNYWTAVLDGPGLRPRHISDEDFLVKIEQFFGPYLFDARSNGGRLDITCFDRAETLFTGYFGYTELVSVYLEYLFQLFEEFTGICKSFRKGYIIEYIRRRLQSYGYDIYAAKSWYYVGHAGQRFRPINVPTYHHIMDHCALTELLQTPFLFQDFECMKRLLRFIAPMEVQTGHSDPYVDEVVQHMRSDPTLFRVTFNPSLLFLYLTSLPARRTKLLLMSVDFLVQKRRGVDWSQNSVDSFKWFYENIPDPWISSQEVSSFIKFIINHLDFGAEFYVQDFCRSFREEFPESVPPRRPRPLLHLCRVEIRKTLASLDELPYGVARLQLPSRLREYVSAEFPASLA